MKETETACKFLPRNTELYIVNTFFFSYLFILNFVENVLIGLRKRIERMK